MPHIKMYGMLNVQIEDNIKIELKEIGSEDANEILTENTDQWRSLVKRVINLTVLSLVGNFLSTLHTVSSLRNAQLYGVGSVLPVTDEYRQEDNIKVNFK